MLLILIIILLNTIMYIYGIGTDGNQQKIGFSKDPEKRLKTLQTANSEELHLHYMFEVPKTYASRYEKYIHNEHNHKRINGEWFEMSAADLKSLLSYHEIMMESTIQLL